MLPHDDEFLSPRKRTTLSSIVTFIIKAYSLDTCKFKIYKPPFPETSTIVSKVSVPVGTLLDKVEFCKVILRPTTPLPYQLNGGIPRITSPRYFGSIDLIKLLRSFVLFLLLFIIIY